MANNKATTMLMGLPLEVRHTIFKYTAASKTKPKKLLRYWFEKKETKELVAKHVAENPNDPAPQVVYHEERDEDSEPDPEAEAEEEDGDDDEDDENEAEGENDDEEAEDGEGNNGENEDDEVDQDGAVVDDDEAVVESDGTQIAATGTSQILASVPTQPLPSLATTAAQSHAQPVSDGRDADSSVAQGDGADEDETEAQDGDGTGDQVMTDQDDDEQDATDAATAVPPPPPLPQAAVISPHHKWRHIPNFMRISQCPPPVELLLASKQLNEEAKNWFYDVAVLRISATSSFAHTSFFEEAFSQITDAAFSPMENIRKVEVLFVWDTTWLRAEETGCAEAIFPALLRQRADFVHQILSQAPDLRDVIIHWHDSAQDNESANFMLDILGLFHSLNAKVQIKEHYIAANAKPHKNSLAGQRRVEFQHIVDAGLDRLF